MIDSERMPRPCINPHQDLPARQRRSRVDGQVANAHLGGIPIDTEPVHSTHIDFQFLALELGQRDGIDAYSAAGTHLSGVDVAYTYPILITVRTPIHDRLTIHNGRQYAQPRVQHHPPPLTTPS